MRRLFHPARRLLRGLGLLLALPVLLTAGYFGLAAALLLWPANHPLPQPADPAAEAYLLDNGVHTDIVLPLDGQGTDWRSVFPLRHFAAPPAEAAYIAVGWGQREFYLTTPDWAALRPGTAWRALSGQGGTLVHVYLLRRDEVLRQARRLPVSAAGARALARHVLATVPQRADGAQVIAGARYGSRDAFFEASGRYTALDTCNTWTGRALREAGLPVSRWTPLAAMVVWHLPD